MSSRVAFGTRLSTGSFLILLSMLLLSLGPAVLGAPTGATIVTNATETVDPAPAGSSTTAGGSFTTLLLNATTQTPRWKAYVGNVTGKFALSDASNATIYDWETSSIAGEVYASRAAAPDWGSVVCADQGSITGEETALNISTSSADSINSTFNESVHATFWVGTKKISNSTCRAIATYVNSTKQAVSENADFQEIILKDTASSLIFTAIINENTFGYDNTTFDFQMIVPEDEYAGTPHTYYFWLELS